MCIKLITTFYKQGYKYLKKPLIKCYYTSKVMYSLNADIQIPMHTASSLYQLYNNMRQLILKLTMLIQCLLKPVYVKKLN